MGFTSRFTVKRVWLLFMKFWSLTQTFGVDMSNSSDKVDAVISDIAAWPPGSKAGEEVRVGQVKYLRTHAHRMRYQTFREAVWHIGSGVMEASCKAVV